MHYKVTIHFRKGPSFSTEVFADSEAQAKNAALRFARDNGFSGAQKSVIAQPAN